MNSLTFSVAGLFPLKIETSNTPPALQIARKTHEKHSNNFLCLTAHIQFCENPLIKAKRPDKFQVTFKIHFSITSASFTNSFEQKFEHKKILSNREGKCVVCMRKKFFFFLPFFCSNRNHQKKQSKFCDALNPPFYM